MALSSDGPSAAPAHGVQALHTRPKPSLTLPIAALRNPNGMPPACDTFRGRSPTSKPLGQYDTVPTAWSSPRVDFLDGHIGPMQASCDTTPTVSDVLAAALVSSSGAATPTLAHFDADHTPRVLDVLTSALASTNGLGTPKVEVSKAPTGSPFFAGPNLCAPPAWPAPISCSVSGNAAQWAAGAQSPFSADLTHGSGPLTFGTAQIAAGSQSPFSPFSADLAHGSGPLPTFNPLIPMLPAMLDVTQSKRSCAFNASGSSKTSTNREGSDAPISTTRSMPTDGCGAKKAVAFFGSMPLQMPDGSPALCLRRLGA